MNEHSISIRGGNCLDPLRGARFESKDLLIKDGFFQPADVDRAGDVHEIDAGSRIVVPGGIFPSFKVPIIATPWVDFDPVASARALLKTGFTTAIVDGLTPFTALDAHQQLHRMPVVNKVPIIDVANFQLVTGFLKSGAPNYAAAAAASLLGKFKGHGISVLGAGCALSWSRPRDSAPPSINDPMPFSGMTAGKLITGITSLYDHSSFKPGILFETGIEGFPGSREQLDGLLAGFPPGKGDGGTRPLVVAKQLSRQALDPAYASGDIDENVSAVTRVMEKAVAVGGLLDLPDLDPASTTYIDNATSPLQHHDHVLARGMVEGEMILIAYKISGKGQRDLAKQFWLAGMELVLGMPAALKDRLAFSLMPGLVTDGTRTARALGSLLSYQYRASPIALPDDQLATSLARERLQDRGLGFPELMWLTRAVPAKAFGLDRLLGGLGAGQIGDAVILDARPEDLDRLLADPDALHHFLTHPKAVIKGGKIAFKNDIVDDEVQGHTITHVANSDGSISGSIEQNIDKQFLKYYSTHIDAKLVPSSLVEPTIQD